jgi:O-antigen/teichoic acid export membrane protein/glycosyltransferase involved in cell wall biosynthesis
MSDHLTQRSFSALGWGYAGFVTRAAAGFLSGLVLARLLGPKPFGQVAAASLVIGFANQIADGGFSLALVQAPQLTEADIRFAFTFQLAVAGALTSFCAVVAPSVAEAFHDPVITSVLRAIALLFIIQGFGLVSIALLKRQLAFRSLQYATIRSYLLGYALGILLAWRGWGVWSLIAAQLVQSAAYSLMVFVQVRHSVTPCFSRRSLYLARFGIKVTGANILNWSLTNFDNAFIGRAFGSRALGLYSRAFNTVSTPADAIVSTWQQVLFVSCSRAGNRTPALRRAYLASLSAITLIMLPVFWSVASCAPTVVGALYGKLWVEVTPMLPPLAVAIALHGAMALAGPVLSAVDRVQYEVKAQLISLMVAIAAFLVAARYSAVAMAWTVLGVYSVRFLAATLPTLRLLELRWRDVFKATRGSIAVACPTAFLVWETERVARSFGLAPALTLAIVGLVGAITVFIILRLAADLVISPDLVALLIQVAPSLPRRLAQEVDKIAERQTLRQFFQGDPSDAVAATDKAPALFIATIMASRDDTGVHTHFNELRRELESSGIDTEVLTPQYAPRSVRIAAAMCRRVVALFNINAASLYAEMHLDQVALWYAMRRRLPRDGPWTVYAQCPRSAITAMSLRRLPSQSVVMIVHFNGSQGEEMVDRGWIRYGGIIDREARRIEKQALLGCDRVVYCSGFMRSLLASRIPGLADRPHLVIPNFVPPLAAAAGGPSGDIITIGTLEPRKNHRAILRIIAEAGKRGRVYKLTIVGRGELDDELKALACELGIDSQVTFAGYVENGSRLLHNHRIYVHAAKMESFGIVLIEAFSAGLPVLAPAVGGIPEILTDGAEGHFWDPDDVEASATQLMLILEDESRRRIMGLSALATYNARFRSDLLVRQLYRFITGDDIENRTQISSAYSVG